MQPLHRRPCIRNRGEGAVGVLNAGVAGLGQRIQDRVQLGTENIGEPALEMPHAVAALLQFHKPAVLLQLVVNRFGPIRIGSVHHSVGEAA